MTQTTKPKLLVAPCDYKAAKYAVEKWHYSQSMPASKTFKMGVWEHESFIGAVIFAWGANRNMASPYNIKYEECAELARVALRQHESPVSQIVSITVKQLIKHSPMLRLLVSYADPSQDHYGGIYQAMNWLYVGQTQKISVMKLKTGEVLHKKTVYSRYGHNNAGLINAEWIETKGKHKYLYPLDRAMRKQIEPLAQPYPKKNE